MDSYLLYILKHVFKKNPFQKLAFVFLLGCGLTYYYQHYGYHDLYHKADNNHTPNLSCRNVYEISEWARGMIPKAAQIDIGHPDFGARVAENFAASLDPEKLFVTDREVKDWVKKSVRGWSNFLQFHDCALFEAWFSEYWILAQSRGRAFVAAHDFSRSSPGMAGSATNDPVKTSDPTPASRRSVQFTRFAKNNDELKARFSLWIGQWESTLKPSLVNAYHGNKKQILIDGLEEYIDQTEKTAETLLMKAVLLTLDSYSTYLSQDEFDEYYADLSAVNVGIGIMIRKVPRGLLIDRVIRESPAGKSSNVRQGDIVTHIDGIDVSGLKFAKAKKLFRTTSASVLRLLKTTGKTIEVAITPGPIDLQDSMITHEVVASAQKPGEQIAWVRIPSFYGRGGFGKTDERSSSEDLKKALHAILKRQNKVSGIVLDLRNNPGGYLDEAIAMAQLFLGTRPMLKMVGQSLERIVGDEPYEKLLYQGPLVILVDKNTASSAEIFAGVLQDFRRALVIGHKSRRTFGKGSVQRLYPLSGNMLRLSASSSPKPSGLLKITTSRYVLPRGSCPDKTGIRADMMLTESTKTFRAKALELASEWAARKQNFLAVAGQRNTN